MVDDYGGFTRGFGTSTGRWASFGPYYAMFPLEFAFEVVSRHSQPGDMVLDPFAGRATSVYAAAVQGRPALGIEITAVGWLFGQAKLHPAPEEKVLERLRHLQALVCEYDSLGDCLPEFYQYCFSPDVLTFLLAARDNLRWQSNPTDMSLMAFIVMYLHGKLTAALSNQMRGTKAMSPQYSVDWWKTHAKDSPPKVDWYEFLRKRIIWRYAKGRPPSGLGELWLGDSTILMKQVRENAERRHSQRCSLLFTSPPYNAVINYYKDQWLRNWMIGGPELPQSSPKKYEKRFSSQTEYRELLRSVFCDAATTMASKSTVYVRTDAREFTFNTTKEVLQDAFPGWKMKIIPVPVNGKTQTSLFGDKSKKPGEMDIILSSR